MQTHDGTRQGKARRQSRSETALWSARNGLPKIGIKNPKTGQRFGPQRAILWGGSRGFGTRNRKELRFCLFYRTNLNICRYTDWRDGFGPDDVRIWMGATANLRFSTMTLLVLGPAGAVGPLCSIRRLCWQWMGDEGWAEFGGPTLGPHNSWVPQSLESAYQAATFRGGPDDFRITEGGREYNIRFSTMTQMNVKTGMVRRIRR